MAKYRTYSIQSKRRVVQQFLDGDSAYALDKRHGIGSHLINVIAEYQAGGLNNNTAVADVLAGYEAQIATLERFVGKLVSEPLKAASPHVRQAKNANRAFVVSPILSQPRKHAR